MVCLILQWCRCHIVYCQLLNVHFHFFVFFCDTFWLVMFVCTQCQDSTRQGYWKPAYKRLRPYLEWGSAKQARVLLVPILKRETVAPRLTLCCQVRFVSMMVTLLCNRVVVSNFMPTDDLWSTSYNRFFSSIVIVLNMRFCRANVFKFNFRCSCLCDLWVLRYPQLSGYQPKARKRRVGVCQPHRRDRTQQVHIL